MPRGTARAKPAEKALVSNERIHSEDGVDMTLIRWMLSLSPLERLQVLERHIASVQRLRGDKT